MCKHGFDVEGFDCPECEPEEKGNIIITVRGGVVQDVEGLPEGWSYTLKDYDDDPDQDDPLDDGDDAFGPEEPMEDAIDESNGYVSRVPIKCTNAKGEEVSLDEVMGKKAVNLDPFDPMGDDGRGQPIW